MFSNYLNSYLKSHKIHYGWVMAGLVFLMTIMASAVSSTPQLIILPITEEYNWQISDITNAIGLMFFTLACLAPFSGALILNLGGDTSSPYRTWTEHNWIRIVNYFL